jgi:acetyltransferase
VLDVVRQCGALGVKAAVVITSGFREIGEAGQQLEREIVSAARQQGMRILGPNCLGVMVPARRLNASFAGELPAPGDIAYISQSGSLLSAIVDMANAAGIGFSKLVSLGNKADIGELEVIKSLGRDPDTRVIAGYLETISDADAFIREAESISHEKPILLIKAGVTWAGSRATSSHTGSLARSEAAYECIFERAGIVRCSSIKAQFDYARALATQPLPAGGNVAVITNGGGPSIMAADAIERQGLALAELDPAAVTAIAAAMPHGAAPGNPVDLLGDARASRYEAALRAALDSPAVDMVLVLLTPHAVTEIAETAEAVVRLAHGNHGKPILTSFLGGHRIDPAIDLLRRGRVPHHDTPESAVETMRVMLDYSRWRSRPRRVVKLFPVNRHKVERIAERNIRRGVFDLGGTDAMEVLDAYGFVAPKGAVATSAEQAAAVAAQIGFPVMLKIWSPDITNKSSVGGVRAGLNSAQEVTDAFDLMMYRVPKKAPGASIAGILVQETCARGREVMLGMTRDPHFGPLMMFGMGGLMVEVLKDVAFYLAPLTADEAREMLLRTRTYQMLRGAPGQEAIDIDAIAEGLQRLSQLAMEFQQIDEIEINPYIVGAQGITPVAVDARIVLAGKPKG